MSKESEPKADWLKKTEIVGGSLARREGGHPIRKRGLHRALKRGEAWAVQKKLIEDLNETMSRRFYSECFDRLVTKSPFLNLLNKGQK